MNNLIVSLLDLVNEPLSVLLGTLIAGAIAKLAHKWKLEWVADKKDELATAAQRVLANVSQTYVDEAKKGGKFDAKVALNKAWRKLFSDVGEKKLAGLLNTIDNSKRDLETRAKEYLETELGIKKVVEKVVPKA